MSTFVVVDDTLLSKRIDSASHRVVFVAPAASTAVAAALGRCFRRAGSVSITLILDPDEEAYRIGYGDREGLEQLQQLANANHIALRSQPGLRLGLLLVDDVLLVWSPTPRAVEGQRLTDQPNGVDLGRRIAQSAKLPSAETAAGVLQSGTVADSLVNIIRDALGADDSDVLPGEAEIGRRSFTPEKVAETIALLKMNPPAPVDLARKTRVLSTKIQFVEFELRGAEWTEREIKLSSLLLNPDVPDELQDLFETRIKPFASQCDVAIEVPVLAQRQVAYNREGKEIMSRQTQTDIERSWKDLRKHYLKQLPGFGWLIQRSDKKAFEADVADFETVLKAWVKGFQKVASNEEAALMKRIVDLINARAERPLAKDKLKDIDIESAVRAGIQKLRFTEPGVKLVFKDVSWESTRDNEFTEALRKALPPDRLNDWFEEFTAVREMSKARS